ncbi:unnamed protein product [Effrenium voratum]|nr:unnamed protein product [Effrenium voratum]
MRMSSLELLGTRLQTPGLWRVHSKSVWSAACMFFELATGDFLFDPKTGDDWDRDEDHLALIAELLGDLPSKEFCLSGKYSKDFFNNSGKLKHIKNLKMWPLYGVLSEKYKLSPEDAQEMTDFLMPMLSWQPAMRRSATEALKHPWVQPREGEVDAGHPFDVSDVACRSHQEPVAKEAPAQTPEAPEEA